MTKVIAVYVGRASQDNLRVGISQGIWGFKKDQPDYGRLQPGDIVILASGFSGGSPRVPSDAWQRGQLESVEIGVVTSRSYHDREPVWPDEHSEEASYPYRFRFEHRGQVRSISLGDDGPLGDSVSESLRLSAIAQGRGYLVADPAGFTLEVPGERPEPARELGLPVVETELPRMPPAESSVADLVDAFERQLDLAGLRFPADLPLRFLCGLMAKPFVIFTGLSGSGKTQLALALGRWLGNDRTFVSSVRPDWTGAEALFGYENLLLPPSEDGRAAWSAPAELRFMLQAADDPEEPYLLLLDEMNLAHVERYFADVLSGMESRAPVLPNLVLEKGTWRIPAGGEPRLPFPPNLLVVGTVNVDETTYQFSPKVLDRSTCIEIRVTTDSLVAERPDLSLIEEAETVHRRAIVRAPSDSLLPLVPPDLQKSIADFHELLATHGREFGHRTFQEMLRFAALVHSARPELGRDTVLDYLVMQKVLPRVHGSSRELSGLMLELRSFAGPESSPEGREAVPLLPLTADKLTRMTAELEATHFTAF